MKLSDIEITRRQAMNAAAIGGAGLMMPAGLQAQGLGSILGLGNILGKASDNALDKLALPGAFYNDEDIRVGLPMIGSGGRRRGGFFGSLLSGARDLGIMDGLVRKLNDAAGVAAGEAKPIFRESIDGLSFQDVPNIARDNTGATNYLRTSSNDQLHTKLNPLVDTALSGLGAYNDLDQLSRQTPWLRAIGISREGLNKTVTDQGLDGIFSYLGAEERGLRANPVQGVGGLLRGLGL